MVFQSAQTESQRDKTGMNNETENNGHKITDAKRETTVDAGRYDEEEKEAEKKDAGVWFLGCTEYSTLAFSFSFLGRSNYSCLFHYYIYSCVAVQ